MPRIGLALSTARAAPIRMPAENRVPTGGPDYGSGSPDYGSGSGSSGAGIGEFLYSDGNILKMWLRADTLVSVDGNPAGGGQMSWLDPNNSNQAFGEPFTSPQMLPESITLSGGSGALALNGEYVKTGTLIGGRPVYEKTDGNGGTLRIFWSGVWVIYHVEDNTYLYYGMNVLKPVSNGNGWWQRQNPSAGYQHPFDGITTTWSPAHASFDGTQYLTIPNPLTGDSAEVFVVCKFDDLPVGEENGPLIGNIGTASEYERWLKEIDGASDRYRIRLGFARSQLTPGNFGSFTDGLGPQVTPSSIERWHLSNFLSAASGGWTYILNQPSWFGTTPAFSASTYDKVIISGAVVSNPGGYELPVNGTYTRNGSYDGRPRYQKASGNGGLITIYWDGGAGYWVINYSNSSLGESAIIYNKPGSYVLANSAFVPVAVPPVTGGTYGGSPSANLISEGPYIGRSTQGGDIKFKGKIAEIMLYNRALTVSERTVVQNYLNQKYSLWV